MPARDRVMFESFLRDMIEGRPERCAPALAPDVVWNLPPFARMEPLRGHDAVMEFVRNGSAPYYEAGSLTIEFHQVMLDAGNAGCRATLRATTKRGMPYENAYAFFARIVDGKLAEVWEMMDTVRFQEQLRAKPGS